MITYTTSNSDETAKVGAKLASQLRGGEVVCLTGPLGSGKTTFVTGFIRHFLPDARVLSPTFTLVRQYQTNHPTIKHIYHLDLYRLKERADVAGLGVEEYMNKPDTVVLIEWPEKLEPHDVGYRYDVCLTTVKCFFRKIRITSDNIL